MSDLQLGLLAVGAVVVAAIVAYNALQERRARRTAERAFGSQHADVLLDADARREPRLDAVRRAAPGEPVALPDARLDYVVELALGNARAPAEVAAHWAPFEHRFANRAILALASGSAWRPLAGAEPCTAVRVALQLASRAGPVAESELIEFRAAADGLAAHLGATVEAPELRLAVEVARELDRLCAEADIQVVLHVVPQPGGEPFPAQAGRAAPGAFGVARGEDGSYMLSLDVPHTADIRRSFESMVIYARDLCAALGGRIVDDNGRDLDERALGAIGAQLDAVRATLAARGIEPGGPAALRLFA
ncbi:MAG: cell division protein ZipA C-terminal FtsZ-binding domain-containing protein [Burkholderiales bacterium]